MVFDPQNKDNDTKIKIFPVEIRIEGKPENLMPGLTVSCKIIISELAASKKQKVQMENNIQELNAQLKSEQASYDLKKLEMERIKFETENKRKIKELEFKQAEIRMNKVKRNLELKPVLDNYDYVIQKIKVSNWGTSRQNWRMICR